MTPIRYVTLPGGYSWVFLVGVWRPVLQILTLFQTKKCHFPRPFLDMEVVTKRNITRLHKTEINVIVAQNKTANDNGKRKPKPIPVFRPKRRKSSTLWGGTYLCGLYKGLPPSPPPRVTLPFTDRWGATSLRYKHRAEIAFLMCEPKPYPVWFSCRR